MVIIVLRPDAAKSDADEILARIASLGLKPLYLPGTERTVIGALGDERVLAKLHLDTYPQVERVTPILTPYKMVSREVQPGDTVVRIGNVAVGGGAFTVIAGPCAVESHEQMEATARAIRQGGGHCLRGGAYKPRSSPYSFQGLGLEGLKLLAQVSHTIGLPCVTEITEVADAEHVELFADAYQVGARNMQNFRLLRAVGQSRKPVILKRGMSATLEELLLAAEYIVSEGNPSVILCERGVRSFETTMRNTLDLAAVAWLKLHTHLPVIVDPSHGTGIRELVAPMAKAAAACGADGILVEVHSNPATALCDGQQSLSPGEFTSLYRELRPFVLAAGKQMPEPVSGPVSDSV